MKIKLLIVQLEAIAGDIDKNIEKIHELLNRSEQKCADLIIMPELWTTGWDCPNFNKHSEKLLESKTYKFLCEIAKKYNSNVFGGSAILRKEGEKDRNTCIILDRNANLLATYDKYHLFSHRGEAEGQFLEEGTTGLVVNTDVGKIGVSICYDIRFPELFRMYAFNGADLIINMAAWPKSFMDEYITLCNARAIENQIYLISSCLTGKINDSFNFSGHSFVTNYRGRIIDSLNEEEKVLAVEIDTEEMHQYRLNMPILQDRKSQYKITEI